MTTENLSILIIEDSDEDYEAMIWALKKTGREYALTRFDKADNAIAYLKINQLPSLLLLDLNLSGLSGHETLKIIKTDERLCIIPVVIVTTSSDPKDVKFCFCNGASGYINKPVNFEKFAESVQILTDYWFKALVLP